MEADLSQNYEETIADPATSDDEEEDDMMFLLTLEDDADSEVEDITNEELNIAEVNHIEIDNISTNRPSRLLKCSLCREKFRDSAMLIEHMNRFHCNLKKAGGSDDPPLKNEVNFNLPESKPLVQCDCGKEFRSKKLFDLHMRSHERLAQFQLRTKEEIEKIRLSSQFQCQCGLEFKHKHLYQRHMQRHLKFGFFQCVCKSKFKTKKELRKHVRMHSIPKPYECECGKSFLTNARLKEHELTHSDLRPKKCEQCDKTYRSTRDLRRHVLAAHIGPRYYKCEKCRKKFASENELEVHTAIHVGPFICHCGKEFKHRKNLKVHTLIHSDVLSFKCDLCEKSFRHKHNVENHVKAVHGNFKKYQCDKCGLQFKNNEAFMTHIVRVHEVPAPLECDGCKQNFVSRYVLTRHILKYHCDAGQFMCDRCGLGFNSGILFKKHLENHAILRCNWCPLKFKTKRALKTHMRFHTSECDYCGQRNLTKYEASQHEKCHAGKLKPFQCISSQNFITETELRQHLAKYKPSTQCYCKEEFATDNDLVSHMLARSYVLPQYSSRSEPDEIVTSNCYIIDPVVTCDLCVVQANPVPRSTIIHPPLKVRSETRTPKKRAVRVRCSKQFEESSYFAIDHGYALQCRCLKCLRGRKYGSHVEIEHSYLSANGSVEGKRNVRWRCKACNIKFHSKLDFEEHKKEVHKKLQEQCSECSLKFNTKRALKMHLKSHSLFECVKCKKRYATFIDLQTHTKLMHWDSQWHSISLENDRINSTHNDVKLEHSSELSTYFENFDVLSYKCPLCPGKTESVDELASHVSGHSNECVSYGVTDEGKLTVNSHCNHD